MNANSVFDNLQIDTIKTQWEDFGSYQKSNNIVTPGGVSNIIGNTLFYKYGYEGMYFNLLTGDAEKKIKLLKMYPEYEHDDVQGNWTTSRSKINDLYGVIVDPSNSTYITIFTKSETKIDIVFNYKYHDPQNERVFYNPHAYYELYNINDNQFIITYDFKYDEGPSKLPEYQSFFVDIKNNFVQLFNFHYGFLGEKNVSTLKTSLDNKVFSSTHNNLYEGSYETKNYSDTHEYYTIESDSIKSYNTYGGAGEFNSWFNVILNDSLSTIVVIDSIKVFNFINGTIMHSFYLNTKDKIIGKYQFTGTNIICLVIRQADGQKRLFAFHYLTFNVVLDVIDNSPYIGDKLAELSDGKFLSFGEGNYIYKHQWSYKFDLINANFSFNLIDDNKFKFIDSSEGAIVSWTWDFGDGSVSNERFPIHQYDNNGKYWVILTVKNENGDVKQISKQIEAKNILRSNFDYNIENNANQRKVICTNHSSDIAVKYIWNFGDGTFSNVINPTHIYEMPGEYKISLTAIDAEGKYKIFLNEKVISIK